MRRQGKASGSGHTACKACHWRWNYTWRGHCYRCSAPLSTLVPAARSSPAPGGAWAAGPPPLAAGAYKAGTAAPAANPQQQTAEPSTVASLQAALSALVRAGLGEEDPAVKATKAKIEEKRAEKTASEPQWKRLRSLQDLHRKKEKQLASQRDLLRKCDEEAAALAVRRAEASEAAAALEVQVAELDRSIQAAAVKSEAAGAPQAGDRVASDRDISLLVTKVKDLVRESLADKAGPLLTAVEAAFAPVLAMLAEHSKAEAAKAAEELAKAAAVIQEEASQPSQAREGFARPVDTGCDGEDSDEGMEPATEDMLKRVFGEAATPEAIARFTEEAKTKRPRTRV